LSELRPIVALYEQYSQILTQRDDALEMIKDPDMKELAEEELNEAKKRIPELEEEIRFEMLPKDPSDNKNIIVEIRAAA
jgi:peptide chain release factor 1